MKNSKLAKLVLVVLMVVMIACIGEDVFAAENTSNYQDLGAELNTTGNNTTGNNATGNNATGNNATNKTSNTSNTLNTSNLTNNAIKNATNNALPKTGISSSTSIVVLITIFGISAIYAYNKIRDYKNL